MSTCLFFEHLLNATVLFLGGLNKTTSLVSTLSISTINNTISSFLTAVHFFLLYFCFVSPFKIIFEDKKVVFLTCDKFKARIITYSWYIHRRHGAWLSLLLRPGMASESFSIQCFKWTIIFFIYNFILKTSIGMRLFEMTKIG